LPQNTDESSQNPAGEEERENTQISDRTAWIRIERGEGLLTCYHDEELGDQTAGNRRESGEEEGERELKNGEEGSRR